VADEDLHRRVEDQSWWNATLTRFWHWVDHRNIDLHIVLFVTLWLTYDVISWAMGFADNHQDMDGVKMAAIIAAVLTPWAGMQAAMFAFYANARKG
jgi:hypothetical protein